MKANRVKKGIGVASFRNVRLGFAALLVGLLAFSVYYLFNHVKPIFHVRKVVFHDNKRLSESELREIARVPVGKSLFTLRGREITRRLLESPWVLSASVRKEFPDTLAIAIEETEPFALLDVRGRLVLIDERGESLEELKDDAVPFLPVILSDPEREREGFEEALKLVRLLNEMGITQGRDHVEVIAHNPNELSVEMDDAVVKIGAGNYEEKLERLLHLEEELKNRNIAVDYIDVRFGDKAFVKPMMAKKKEE